MIVNPIQPGLAAGPVGAVGIVPSNFAAYARPDYRPLARSFGFGIHEQILARGRRLRRSAFGLLRPHRHGHGQARSPHAYGSSRRREGLLPVRSRGFVREVTGWVRVRIGDGDQEVLRVEIAEKDFFTVPRQLQSPF